MEACCGYPSPLAPGEPNTVEYDILEAARFSGRTMTPWLGQYHQVPGGCAPPPAYQMANDAPEWQPVVMQTAEEPVFDHKRNDLQTKLEDVKQKVLGTFNKFRK